MRKVSERRKRADAKWSEAPTSAGRCRKTPQIAPLSGPPVSSLLDEVRPVAAAAAAAVSIRLRRVCGSLIAARIRLSRVPLQSSRRRLLAACKNNRLAVTTSHAVSKTITSMSPASSYKKLYDRDYYRNPGRLVKYRGANTVACCSGNRRLLVNRLSVAILFFRQRSATLNRTPVEWLL